jgi:hypothetical protein
MANFRHYELPGQSGAKPSAPRSKKKTHSRQRQTDFPTVMTSVSEDLTAGRFTARFKHPKIQAGAAHLSRFIMPSSDTFYVPFKNPYFVFSNTTVDKIELLGDKAFTTDWDPNPSPGPAGSPPDPDAPSAKRKCVRKDRKTLHTRLNVMRPVKNSHEVIQDAWRLILGQTSPEFLLEARTVCKEWNSLLQEDTIWMRARIEKYGEDAPSPPKGVSERRFADLLVGKGCQNRTCPRRNTIKVFWAYRTRMCEDCSRERTVKEENAGKVYGPLIGQHNLLELLPSGVLRSGKYKGTSRMPQETDIWTHPGNKVLYLCLDVERLLTECISRIAEGHTDEDAKNWRTLKIEESQAIMRQTVLIEEWERRLHQDAPDLRADRISFFEMKAMELLPPMLPEVLHKMQAYHTAINSRRPPSEKCWSQLRLKVLGFRAAAETLVNYERQAESFGGANMPDIERFSYLHSHRFARGRGRRELLREQQYVIHLAKQELSRCENSTPPVADEDLVLLTLRNVFRRHSQTPLLERPCGLNANLHVAPLTLTLDDARLIIEEVFECRFGDDPRRNHVILEGFRCKGCCRQDCNRRYRFVELFKHIYHKHAHRVGDGYNFSYFAQPFPPYGVESSLKFPWYTTNWPSNLPIAASHQEVHSEDIWTPHAQTEYVQLTRLASVSVFRDRVAHKTDLAFDDFLGNLAHAAGKLKNTALDKELQTKIFLQYALDLWQRSPRVESGNSEERRDSSQAIGLTLEHFADAMTQLRRANSSLSLRYRCGTCVKARGAPKGARYVKNSVDFHELLEHWSKKHAGLDWRYDMMDLPDDCEVLGLILKADAELQQNKAALQARDEAKVKNPRKKGNAKATVILGMYNGMEVFDRLFYKWE